jgi:XTP/dITP diphosphohydrolase
MNVQFPSLLLGTRNAGKVREIETILADVPWELRSLRDFDTVAVPPETAPTYAGNAMIKARFYARETGLCALADDSGLEVEALDGAPGVLSARYAGEGASDADRRALLLSELARVSKESARESDRSARFVCAVAIATPDGEVLNVSEGVCPGTIIFEPRGTNGFGYDPLFVPEGFDQTFAKLSDTVKNRISHRARALLKTRTFLLSSTQLDAPQSAQLDQQTSDS